MTTLRAYFETEHKVLFQSLTTHPAQVPQTYRPVLYLAHFLLPDTHLNEVSSPAPASPPEYGAIIYACPRLVSSLRSIHIHAPDLVEFEE